MNRRTIGYDPRLSTPGRSRLSTDDWYNKLYEYTREQVDEPVKQAKEQRSADYRNTNFGNFAEAYGFDDAKFLDDRVQALFKEDEHVD